MLLLSSLSPVASHLTKTKVESPQSLSQVPTWSPVALLWPHFLPLLPFDLPVCVLLELTFLQLLHFLSTAHQSLPVLCMIFFASFCSLCKHASPEKSSDCTIKKQISPSALYSSHLPMVFELTNLLSLPRLFLFKIIHKTIEIK